jgi:hypothetical protein
MPFIETRQITIPPQSGDPSHVIVQERASLPSERPDPVSPLHCVSTVTRFEEDESINAFTEVVRQQERLIGSRRHPSPNHDLVLLTKRMLSIVPKSAQTNRISHRSSDVSSPSSLNVNGDSRKDRSN